MAVQDGISEAQALKLLELAKLAKKMPNVKTVDKDIRCKPGRAILLGLKNHRTAIIKPFKHGGKEEIADLSTIRFWKSGCDFDITEVLNMKTTPSSLAPATGVSPGMNDALFGVIYSKKMNLVWGGEQRKWTSNFHQAITWMNIPEAERCIQRLRGVSMCDDAELLPKSLALSLLSAPVAKTPNKEAPVTMPTPSLSPSIVAAAMPQPSASVLLDSEDDFLDMDVLLNPNETKLRLAEAERKKAAEEYSVLKKTLAATFEKLKQLNSQVVLLGGRSGMKSSAGAVKNEVPSGNRGIKKAIISVLKEHSRLDAQGIFSRISSSFPAATLDKVKSSLLSMRDASEAERDPSGGWALTSKGK